MTESNSTQPASSSASPKPSPKPQAITATRAWAIVEVLLFAWIAWVRLSSPGMSWFNEHMSRDLARALSWNPLHPSFASSFLGPELDLNGRLPGPFFYVWLAFGLSLAKDLLFSLTFLRALMIVPYWLAYREIKDELGRVHALNFLLFFAVLPIQVYVSRSLWNPSLVVPLQLLAFYFFTRTVRSQSLHESRNRIVAFILVLAAGIQTHFSTLSSTFSGSTALLIRVSKSARKWVIVGLASIALFTLAVWHLNPGTAPKTTATARGFDFSKPVHASDVQFFLSHYDYHLVFVDRPLGDYDVFPLFFRYGRRLSPSVFSSIDRVQPFLLSVWKWLIPAAFFGLLILMARSYFLRKKPLNATSPVTHPKLKEAWSVYVVLQVILALFPLYFYIGRANRIPFRYGLMLYPALALVVPLFLARLRDFFVSLRHPASLRIDSSMRVVSMGILCMVGLTFLVESEFDLSMWRLMKASGRAANTTNDDLEMPLGYKLEILQKMRIPELGESNFGRFHGPIVNRVRMFEFNSNYTGYYGGLTQALQRNPDVERSDSLRSDTAYELVDLKPEEMLERFQTRDSSLPFKWTPLPESFLPHDVQVEAMTEKSELLSQVKVPDGSLILPLESVDSKNTKRIRVRFKLLPTLGRDAAKTLRIAFDKSNAGAVLDLLHLKLDGRETAVALPAWVPWREQTLGLVTLPDFKKPIEAEAEFSVAGFAEYRFTRLDIWLSEETRRPTEI